MINRTISVDLGPDTSVCGLYLLDAGNPGSSYNWSTGERTQTIYATDTNDYWVEVNNGCLTVSDTVHVNRLVSPRLERFIPDTAVYCTDSSVTVDARNWGFDATYLWDDNSTGRTNTFSASGSHWVEVATSCDTARKNFEVVHIDSLGSLLGPDTAICNDAYGILPAVEIEGDFLWSDNSTGNALYVDTSGTYWLRVITCDTLYDTINVTLSPPPAEIEEDTIDMCSGSSVTITSESRENATYLWSNNSTTSSISVSQPGNYWLEAYGACDTITDTVHVLEVFPLDPGLGVDTAFCEPNFISLSVADLRTDSVYWNVPSVGDSIIIDSSGTYKVEVYNACGMFSDSINVQVDLLPDTVVGDTSFCYDSDVLVSAQQPQVDHYVWSTGDSTSGIRISQEGFYYVDLINDCGTVRDSFHIGRDTIITPFSVGSDTVLCGPTLIMDPGDVGGTHYLWQDSIPGREFTANTSGTYWVTARNACNSYTDTIDVTITGPPALVLGTDVRFCDGTTLTLNAQNELLGEYQWSTGDTTQRITVDSAGKYYVTITNNCGQVTDSVDVIVEFPMNDLDIGTDTLVCRGDSLELVSQYPQYEANWSTGDTSQSIFVDSSGTYWVEKSNTCGVFTDSIVVEVQDIPVFSLGRDTVYCYDGRGIALTGPEGMQSYQWNTGDTTRFLYIQDSTATYSLTVENECFEYTDEILVDPQKEIELELGPDTSLCFGQSLFLHPGEDRYGLVWSDNSQDSVKEVTRSGRYWVFSENACGFYYDTIKVDFHYPLDVGPLDTTLCEGDSIVFDFTSNLYDVEWADTTAGARRVIRDTGMYQVTINNDCGTYERDIHIADADCECPFFVADAFTPGNDDGLNDTFFPKYSCELTYYNMVIVSREGGKVFETNNPEEGWDGSYRGKAMPIGTYVYRIEYRWSAYGVERSRLKRGTVTLVR